MNNMNLENQVCSLELAKKLVDLGIEQNSTFYWFKSYDYWLLHYIDYNHHETDSKIFKENNSPCYSAFTVSELCKMLPDSLSDDYLVIAKGPDFYNAYYNHTIHGLSYYGFFCKNENFADCLAGLFIYLLENKLMELKGDV